MDNSGDKKQFAIQAQNTNGCNEQRFDNGFQSLQVIECLQDSENKIVTIKPQKKRTKTIDIE